MMLSKPNTEEQQQQQQQQEETDILQRPTPLPASLVKKNKTAEDAMADLERRLDMLGAGAGAGAVPTTTTTTGSVTTNASSAAAPVTAAAIPMGGKNALLARIKAAQERAKQTPGTSPAVTPSAPVMMARSQPPPPLPASDAAALQIPSMMDMMTMMAPPSAAAAAAAESQYQQQSFDTVSRPQSSMSFDPLALSSSSVNIMADDNHKNNNNAMFLAPSASALDDLLDNQHQQQQQQEQQQHNHAQGHLLSMQPPMAAEQQEEESLESILAALEGLSEEEKQALLAEQGKILASIEKTKISSADARANAFEQRSLAGALRAPTTTAVDHASNFAAAAAMTPEEAQQMKADMELAEQLQKGEYDRAERENTTEQRRRRTQQSSSSPSSSPQQAAAAHEPGWMEWLGFAAPAPAPPARMAERRRPLQRGEIGVSLPPGSSSPSRGGGGLATPIQSAGAQQGITFTPSYDDADQAEDAAFLRGNRGSPAAAARVAQRQPLFSCVADSITSAATSISTALQMTEDDEGNVHGVDSSGLLGVNNTASGGRDSNNNQESTTPYERAG